MVVKTTAARVPELREAKQRSEATILAMQAVSFIDHVGMESSVPSAAVA